MCVALFGIVQKFSSENSTFGNKFLYIYINVNIVSSVWPMWPKRNSCWCSIHSGVSNMSATQISQNDNKRHIKNRFIYIRVCIAFFSTEIHWISFWNCSKQSDSFFSSSPDAILLFRHWCICLSFRSILFLWKMCLYVFYSCGVLLMLQRIQKEPNCSFHMACVWYFTIATVVAIAIAYDRWKDISSVDHFSIDTYTCFGI